MTAFRFTKAHGRYAADGLGSWKQRNWLSHDAEASLEGGRSLVLQRGNWGRVFRASDAGGLVIGEFDKKQWMREGGPVRWDGVDYEFATKSGWKGTFALSRYGEELAEFKVTGLKQDVVITMADGVSIRPPAALLLFASWICLMFVRDRAAAAG